MTKPILRLLPALALACLGACASFDHDQDEPISASDKITRSELGGTRNVTTLGDLTMSGQPSADDLALAEKRGITRVINIRTQPELDRMDFDEGARCSELDLEYVHVSFRGDTATDEIYDVLLDLLALPAPDHGGTLFHCASGNRTALIVALLRMRDHGIDYDAALADALAAGMKPSSLAPMETQATRLGLR